MKRPLRKTRIILLTIAITLIAVILYANLRSPQAELAYHIEDSSSVESEHFEHVIGELLGPQVIGGNEVRALYNGDQIFPAMLKAIREAKKTICFESYIYWSGEIGQQFADALAERAKHGVKVHVLIDWMGSQKINPKYIEEMQDAGAQIRRYHVLHWYSITRLNNRTHRKVLVVDGEVGFTGGVGIADEWSGDGLQPGKWRDSHYEARGPVVGQMQATFMDNWLKLEPEVHQSEDYFPEPKAAGKMKAQMFKSSSREGTSSMRIMYLMAIAAAKKSIYLESSYFVPDERAVDELVKAQKRGVDVQLLVPGNKTDVEIVRYASRDLWRPLLEAGVKIYEYEPAMLHCKVFVVDGYFTSIGSTNFDERSFRLNDEANLNVLDHDFAAGEMKMFAIDRQRSKLITLKDWENRPFFHRIFEKFSSILSSQL